MENIIEEKKEIKSGFLVEKLPKNKNWIFGGVTGIEKNEPQVNNWQPYLPSFERQKKRIDTMACITFSALNVLETKFNYYLREGLFDEDTVKWLRGYGYIGNDGLVNFSDRFIAKLSNTTFNGNSYRVVGDTIREYGLVPESLWNYDDDIFNWEDYYKEVPQSVIDIGKEFKKKFKINYEFVNVSRIGEAIKYSPIQCGVWAWPEPINGVYPKVDKLANHGVMLFVYNNSEIKVFDTYQPSIKNLELSYRFGALAKYSLEIINNQNIIMTNIPDNTLIQLVEGIGGFALVLNGKKIVDDLDKVLASYIVRSAKEIDFQGEKLTVLKQKPMAVTQEIWDSLPTVNLKGQIS